ncbi:MAG: NAD(P)-dependent oxidoreductase [Gemmatimonadota bacterium]|nr:NAD(P)-dependent oxidoreductase [Gemmatimonadota bacterium]MDH5198093.1 NAD(P)-dependent oxidoreductase [Gemmatimonadota bacterium]
MRAFVTGGTGFVGSHLVEHLLAAGHDVTCLVRSPAKAEGLFADRRPRLVQGAIDDGAAIRAGSAGCEVVFHVAGITSARARREFFAVNEGGTIAVLGHVPRTIKRFVCVSSLAAAGPTRPGVPLEGHERASPVTHYGASKLAAELAVRGSGLPWTIIRPPAVYGPRDIEFLRVFRLVRGPVIPVFGSGRQELTFIHVTDLARALLAAAEAEATAGNVYYGTHPEIVDQRTFMLAVARAVRTDGRLPRILPIPAVPARAALWVTGAAAFVAGRATVLTADKANEFLADSFACSPAPLERDAGWHAEFDLASGLPPTAAWYREHRWL